MINFNYMFRMMGFLHLTVLASLTLASSLMSGQASAASACFQKGFTNDGPWLVNNDLPTIATGTVVASVAIRGKFEASGMHGGAAFEFAGRVVGSLDPTYFAIPIDGVPGLGLRVKWQGYELESAEVNGSPVSITTSPITLKPIGTPVQLGFERVAVARLSGASSTVYSSVILYNKWLYELVVLNDRVYVGGQVNFQNITTMGVAASAQELATSAYVGCSPAAIYGTTFLGSSLPVPPLPKPPTPTCIFNTSTLNQTVSMDPASTVNVPAVTDLRTAGSETPFSIMGFECGEGTRFDLYFTDGSAPDARKTYLNPTVGSTIGVRLYHDNDITPVEFGPAPNGSNTPPQRPVSIGPVQGTANVQLYAQYTRVPGVAANQVVPGVTGAMTTVTVVYP